MSGIPAWAYRGAKVVCVDDAMRGDTTGIELPKLDQTYTIRHVIWNTYWRGWQTRLVEVVNQPQLYNIGFVEAAWNLSRFKPLITQQDDLEAHFNQFLHHTTPAIPEGV